MLLNRCLSCLYLSTCLLMAFSCREEEATPVDGQETPVNYQDDWLIFGVSYGECMGDCTTLYKLTSRQLYADDMAQYNRQAPLIFDTQALSNEKFRQAQALLPPLPEALLINEQEIYGEPDAHDQGTLVVIISRRGTIYHRFLDTDESSLPATLRSYARQLKEVLSALENE